VFDEFIAKGEKNINKVGRTLLLTRWLREETCLRGRADIESVRGSFEFELFFALSFGLPLFLPFVGFAVFSSSRLPSRAFFWLLVF
jgi:hypothetical protein